MAKTDLGEEAGNEPADGTLQTANDDNDALPMLPDDYYVKLQPLTLDLIATQLERIGVACTREPDAISADSPDFVLTARILSDDLLSVRSRLRQTYPAAAITALTGRCNWWNGTEWFLKASVSATIDYKEPPGEDDERQPLPAARICLDADVPFRVGVAPVQLQELFRQVVRNITMFEQQARLSELFPPSAW